jgi:tetratricopeptide (TPR) repeat protein
VEDGMKNTGLQCRGGRVAWMAPVALALLACGSAGTSTVRAFQGGDPAQRGIDLYKAARYAEAETVLRDVAGVEAKAYLAASIAKLGSAEQAAERKGARYREAEGIALAVLTAAPSHEVAAAAVGEALVGQEKYDDAIARLSAVIAAKNDVAYAYFWRGKAYNAKSQTARMMDDFRAFLKLAPHAPEAPAVRALLSALK